jgi:hypothetical protein
LPNSDSFLKKFIKKVIEIWNCINL